MLTNVDDGRFFAERINDVPRSFIREILKVALQSDVISFAGGLPNRDLFPRQALKMATEKVFDLYGGETLQYSSTEGFVPLREYISERYRVKHGLSVPVEDILITSGSQQGLDLLGKILVNEGSSVVMEEPGYLGAIQAFSIYRPAFCPVPVSEVGMDLKKLRDVVRSKSPRLVYSVPNFQNPSGISYTQENRESIAGILGGTSTIIIEDDPYGGLRFSGSEKSSFLELSRENTVLLGSFSKVVVPGFRLGWIVAPDPIMKKLIIAKQATDLHTTHFTQCIMHQYLTDNSLDDHVSRIVEVYGNQKDAMVEAIGEFFPAPVTYTDPEGGMFLWARLPDGYSALELFDLAVKEKVVFVPGDPFYIDADNTPTLRLSFSCVNEQEIRKGVKALGVAITHMLDRDPVIDNEPVQQRGL